MKQIINLTLITSILFSCFIYPFNSVSWSYHMIILVISALFYFNNASKKSNYNLFKNISLINFTIFILLCIKSFLLHGSSFFAEVNEEYYFIVCLIISCLAMTITIIEMCREVKSTTVEKPNLLPNRKNDLEKLVHYVQNFEIVGLNGDWGTGKSFLTSQLKTHIDKNFYFIEINTLVTNLDNIQPYLINQFEHLLYSKKIIPNFSNTLSSNFKNLPIINKFNLVFSMIFKNTNFSSTILTELQKEISKLDKKVLVIFEDIDRINDIEIIKEIFAINEKLASNNIHFLYEYDESKLIKLKFTQDYLEKYIPTKINLTHLDFLNLLAIELKQTASKNIELKMFDFIKNYSYRDNFLLKKLDFIPNFRLNFEFISIRKIKNLIRELELNFNINNVLFKNHPDTVIAFFLIKHFIPEVYGKIDMTVSLFDMELFSLDDKSYSLQKIFQLDINQIENKELIIRIFKSKENQLTACCLELLGVEIDGPITYNDESHIDTLLTRSSYKNNQISRIIRHLAYAGTSKINDQDYAVQRILSEVLIHKNFKSQKEAFSKYHSEMFNSTSLDNRTIFLFGVPIFVSIFEAFDLANTEANHIDNLIDFYIQYSDVKHIDLITINVISKIPFKSSSNFFKIISYFNGLEITGNFNRHKDFYKFINKIISSLPQLSLIDVYSNFNRIMINSDINYALEIEILNCSIEKTIEHISTLQSAFEKELYLQMYSDLDLLKEFFLKIKDMINHPVRFIPPNPVSIRYSDSKTKNQAEYNRLLDLDSNLNLIEEINRSYIEGKLSLYEFTKLMSETKSRKNQNISISK